MTVNSAHELTFTALDGGALPLSAYAGKPVLIVNTASECGYTPQYAGLQALWEAYGDRGLVVLGVPCNDFGGQEPGGESEIADFCVTRYAVSFPMTAKSTIAESPPHPFYAWIGAQLGEDHLPKWNFHKYLLDRDGQLAGAWPSAVEPDADVVVAAVEENLPGAAPDSS